MIAETFDIYCARCGALIAQEALSMSVYRHCPACSPLAYQAAKMRASKRYRRNRQKRVSQK